MVVTTYLHVGTEVKMMRSSNVHTFYRHVSLNYFQPGLWGMWFTLFVSHKIYTVSCREKDEFYVKLYCEHVTLWTEESKITSGIFIFSKSDRRVLYKFKTWTWSQPKHLDVSICVPTWPNPEVFIQKRKKDLLGQCYWSRMRTQTSKQSRVTWWQPSRIQAKPTYFSECAAKLSQAQCIVISHQGWK